MIGKKSSSLIITFLASAFALKAEKGIGALSDYLFSISIVLYLLPLFLLIILSLIHYYRSGKMLKVITAILLVIIVLVYSGVFIYYCEFASYARMGVAYALGLVFYLLTCFICLLLITKSKKNSQNIFVNDDSAAEIVTKDSNLLERTILFTFFLWCIIEVSQLLIQKFVVKWYEAPYTFYFFAFGLIQSIMPLIFAFNVKNKSIRLICILLAIVLCLTTMYRNIDWIFSSWND